MKVFIIIKNKILNLNCYFLAPISALIGKCNVTECEICKELDSKM